MWENQFGDLKELIRSKPMYKRGLVALIVNFIFPFVYFLFYFSISLSSLFLSTLFLSVRIPVFLFYIILYYFSCICNSFNSLFLISFSFHSKNHWTVGGDWRLTFFAPF